MRLTKTMKENLVTILVNKMKNPAEVQADKLAKAMQDKIFEEEPVFKQFIETYDKHSKFSQCVAIRLDTTVVDIRFFVPTDRYMETNICEEGLSAWTTRINPHNVDKIKWFTKFEEIGTEIIKVAKEAFEYDNVIQNLKATINSCTTDKELANMYPDFVQFFNSAGITQVAKRQVPARLGLPESLEKYGLVLNSEKDKEAKQKDLQETIKEDIEGDR